MVDAGAGATTVAVALPGRGPRAAVIPLGGADLEAEVACALRAELPTAREVLRAHAAGALRVGGPSAAGPGAARAVRRLAAHHAGIWADALELVLAGLTAERPLPGALLLCGGASALPGAEPGAGPPGVGPLPVLLPAPRAHLLRGDDVPGIEDRALALPVLQAPPLLAAAAAAGARSLRADRPPPVAFPGPAPVERAQRVTGEGVSFPQRRPSLAVG